MADRRATAARAPRSTARRTTAPASRGDRHGPGAPCAPLAGRALRLVPERRPRRCGGRPRTSLILLLVPTALLTAIGIVMVLSASSVTAYAEFGSSFLFFNRQVIYAVVGVVGLLVGGAGCRTRCGGGSPVPLLVVTVVLLILALTAGRAAYGASRWLYVGSDLAAAVRAREAGAAGVRGGGARRAKWRRLDELRHLIVPIAARRPP